ncbi:thioredoxin domain-containing protein [Corynebacterium sp. CCM 9204]|uniref:thioredoxin domain-containing protein n=1 Tax=Corynebacterium sp. CCM 9204 TaxID=3057616 RepID=UPI0035236C6D
MGNRLSGSDSTYLRQHADDPVDWWTFGPEAFAEASHRDVPVLVSIGYAACHWCHVMARESFSNPDIAALLNEHVVCVKVDREQHPDVDALYMQATIALSGHGGWPMTVFTDPEGRPFYADTYVPPEDRPGRPGLPRLIRAVDETWRNRRSEIADMGEKVREMMALHSAPVRPVPTVDKVFDRVTSALQDSEDPVHGGFGGAPKFPPSATLLGLTRRAERTGDDRVHALVGRTIESMVRGGIFDQIGGGFARYTVDAAWRTPHFEKMLDDNALLLRALVAHAHATGDPLATRAADDTARFLLTSLRRRDGLFATSLDADTDGVEGATYRYTRNRVSATLGDSDDANWIATLFGISNTDDAEGGSVPTLSRDPDDMPRFLRIREQLAAARARDPQPGRDDTATTTGTAMAAVALSEAAELLPGAGNDTFRDAAVHAILGLDRLHRTTDGGFLRVSGGESASLADLAWLALASTRTASAATCTGDEALTEDCLRILRDALNQIERRHADPDNPGTYFDSGSPIPVLGLRARDPFDTSAPAGVAVAGEAFFTGSMVIGATGDADTAERWASRGREILAVHGEVAGARPLQAGGWLSLGELAASGPTRAVVTSPTAEALSRLRRQLDSAAIILGTGPSGIRVDGPHPGRGTHVQICRAGVCGRTVAL